MKSFKKLAGLALAMIMALALMAPAFAAEGKTITITNPVEGQTYTLYKVFDYTSNKAATTYSYTTTNSSLATAIESASAEGGKLEGLFTITLQANSDPATYNVVPKEGFNDDNAKTFAAWLNDNRRVLGTGTEKSATKDNLVEGKLSFTGLTDDGYYFIDTSLGSVCSLVGTNDVYITEKNQEPGISKTIVGTTDGKNVAGVGDTVNYEIRVNTQATADTSYVVHDDLSEGLTLNANSFKFYLTAKDAPVAENATEATLEKTLVTEDLTDGCDFEITFSSDVIKNLNNRDIVIHYSATINNDAVNYDVVTNTASLEYGGSSKTVQYQTNTYIGDFQINKYTGTDTRLAGAKFELKKADGTAVNFKFEGGVYNVVTDAVGTTGTTTELVSTDSGNIQIKGLGAGTYTLTETEAPDGYNKLTSDITITVSLNSTKDGDAITAMYDGSSIVDTTVFKQVNVVNNSGAVLPDTGGIGTTIFYTLGGLLLVGSIILFVTKKRTGMAG